jgi:uncharacterized protein YjbI with pentapeptide repeats
VEGNGVLDTRHLFCNKCKKDVEIIILSVMNDPKNKIEDYVKIKFSRETMNLIKRTNTNKKIELIRKILLDHCYIRYLNLSKQILSSFPNTKNIDLAFLTKINLSHNNLTFVPNFNSLNVEYLNLSHNQIYKPDIVIGRSLKWLNLKNNFLSDLNFLGGPHHDLLYLNVNNNKFKTIPDLSDKFHNLREFNFTNNVLSVFPDINYYNNLRTITISQMKIPFHRMKGNIFIDCSRFNDLREIYLCWGFNVDDIHITGLKIIST